MRRTTLILLVLASIAFVASSVSFALMPHVYDPVVRLIAGTGLSDAATPAMARPMGGALRLLLVGVWLAVALHAIRAVLVERRIARLAPRLSPHLAPEAAPRLGRRLTLPRTALAHGPFIAALVAGAVWPWAASETSPLPELVLAVAMMVCALWAALERRRKARTGPIFSGTVEMFAGWATIAAYSSFGEILIKDLGLSVPLAAVVSVLLLMVTVVEVQLRLNAAVAYGFTVIWALIGIAGNAIQTDLTVATAAIAAIAAIAAVLVRVMS